MSIKISFLDLNIIKREIDMKTTRIYEVIKNKGYNNEEVVLTTTCVYEADEEMMNLDAQGYPSTYRLKK